MISARELKEIEDWYVEVHDDAVGTYWRDRTSEENCQLVQRLLGIIKDHVPLCPNCHDYHQNGRCPIATDVELTIEEIHRGFSLLRRSP